MFSDGSQALLLAIIGRPPTIWLHRPCNEHTRSCDEVACWLTEAREETGHLIFGRLHVGMCQSGGLRGMRE